MDSHDQSNNPEQSADHDTAGQLPPTPPIPPGNSPERGQEPSDSNRNTTTRELAREVRLIEVIAVIVNFGLAVVGIAALFIYYGQLQIMNAQSGAMNATISQTKLILRQYIAQTKAAQISADAAKSSADISAEALTSNERSARREQRAYVVQFGPIDVSNLPRYGEPPPTNNPPVLDRQIEIRATIKNIGKSISKDQIFTYRVGILQVGSVADVERQIDSTVAEAVRNDAVPISAPQDMAPGGEITNAPEHATLQALSPTEIDGIRAQRIGILFAGQISYADIFGNKHHTEFCVIYTGELIIPRQCLHHNRTD